MTILTSTSSMWKLHYIKNREWHSFYPLWVLCAVKLHFTHSLTHKLTREPNTKYTVYSIVSLLLPLPKWSVSQVNCWNPALYILKSIRFSSCKKTKRCNGINQWHNMYRHYYLGYSCMGTVLNLAVWYYKWYTEFKFIPQAI